MDLTNRQQAKLAGELAEAKAKQYLIAQNLDFIEQNFRVSCGEIDLIFKDQNQLVFVEVKYRSDSRHGCAAEYFTPAKRHKMIRAIMCYLQQHHLNLHHTDMRIDLVAIDDQKLNWLRNV